VLRHNLTPYVVHADFTVIPAAGHFIPLEAPGELSKAILEFAPPAR
jgi:pimeloyl-ACP methyl ester carboxylesterase